MDERGHFMRDWLEGDWNMSELCTHYDISRKTGYKWVRRFKAEGLEGLYDQSRAKRVHYNETLPELKEGIISMRHKHPSWGPKKILARLARLRPEEQWPVTSTIGDILKRNGLVRPRMKRRRTPIYDGPFCAGLKPNAVWATDFKGWFRTLDGSRVDPFTLTDGASRSLLRCQAVPSNDGETVRRQFLGAFLEFGLPDAIRSDNGTPFASVGLGGLSRLSVWFVRLGIRPERIRPGHPEENGAHERMHKTLKDETTNPPAATLGAQQKKFDRFQKEFNEERPHEALGMLTPADVYYPSTRQYPSRLPELEYPAGMTIRKVNDAGVLKWHSKQIFISHALAREHVGLSEVNEGLWELRYGPLVLGMLDQMHDRIKRRNEVKVLPMSPV